jgi:hypothetical protein
MKFEDATVHGFGFSFKNLYSSGLAAHASHSTTLERPDEARAFVEQVRQLEQPPDVFAQRVGWVERSDTHHFLKRRWVSRRAQPTYLSIDFARRANHFVFSEMVCPAPFAKIFPFPPDPNHFYIHHRLVPIRGAIARRHERGTGCGGRESARRAMAIAGRDEPRERSASARDDRRFSGRQSRVVLTPVAGAKLAEAKSSPTGFDEPLIRQ